MPYEQENPIQPIANCCNCFKTCVFLVIAPIFMAMSYNSSYSHYDLIEEKQCIANQRDWLPIAYNTTEQLDHILTYPSVEVVNTKFMSALYYGFYVNIILASVYLVDYLFSKCKLPYSRYTSFFALLRFIATASWWIHFFTMVVYRFQHSGRVCSGDFNYKFHYHSGSKTRPKPFQFEFQLTEAGGKLYTMIFLIGLLYGVLACCMGCFLCLNLNFQLKSEETVYDILGNPDIDIKKKFEEF